MTSLSLDTRVPSVGEPGPTDTLRRGEDLTDRGVHFLLVTEDRATVGFLHPGRVLPVGNLHGALLRIGFQA
jgi:hypothetical protein